MYNPWKDILNDKELEIFSDILAQTQVIKEKSKESKKVRGIVPIREWVESEYYVGPAGMGLYPFWKSKLIEVFDENRSVPVNEVIVTGGLGCRPIDSLYQTDYGVLNLSQIKRLIESNEVKILCPRGTKTKIVDVHYVGVKDTIKIKFNTGYIMEASIDHRIRVLVDGKVVWRRFDEIKLGDRVIKSNRQDPISDLTWKEHNVEKALDYFHKSCVDRDDMAVLVALRASLIFPVEIESSSAECGDIEVEGHEYVNEGIIQHNTGKSTFGIFCIIRKIYELSCYTNIPSLFNLMPGTFISFMYFTVSRTQAEITGYGQIKSIIDSIPYFLEKFPRNDRLQSMLVFPEKLLLMYGSSQMHSIGLNMIGSILDEANFFQGNAQSLQKSAADYSKIGEMYAAIVNRSKSRFKSYKRDASLSVLISSNTTSSSFTEKRIAECEGEPNTLIINSRVWDVKPKGTYSDKVFYVFTGSDLLDPSIVYGLEDIYQYTDSIDVPRPVGDTVEEALQNLLIGRDKFVEVPEDFKKQYEDNIIMSLQDISGLSVAPSGRLFSSRPLYNEACNTVYAHPFYKAEIVISTHDNIRVSDYLNKRWSPVARHKKRFIHIDQSTTNDSTGFAVSFVDRYVKDDVTGIFYPVVVTELLVRINPPRPPKKISIAKVRDFVFYLRDHFDLEIGWVSYDQFQCLTGDTLVKMDNGYKRLDEVKVGDRVVNDSGVGFVKNVYSYKDAPVMSVVTSRGKVIKGTPNHKLRVLQRWTGSKRVIEEIDECREWSVKELSQGTRRPIWTYKRIDQLEVGDILDVEYFCEDTGVDLNLKAISLNEETKKMFMYVLGFAFGDASFSSDGFKFSFGSKEEMEYVMSLVDRVTGYSHKRHSDSEVRNYASFSSRALMRELMGYGLCLCTSLNKRVPKFIKNLKNALLIEFLNGYIDSDGSVSSKDNLIRFTSVSKGLLEDIKWICEYRLGIRCWVDDGIDVGARLMPNGKVYDNNHRAYHAGISGDTFRILSVYGKKLNIYTARRGRYVYDKVKAVKLVGRDTVYDIEVDNEHAYFANGIYSHNSSESLQTLEENGIPCGLLSVDRDDVPYLTFVQLFYEHRIETYRYPPAEKELFEVVHYRDKHRVDHPSNGSKDVLDAWVGSVYNAIVHTKDETPIASSSKESGLIVVSGKDTDPYDVMELVQGEL